MATLRKYDPDQPRDGHGEWTAGGGGGGVTDVHRERAGAALADKAFLADHRDRLIAAAEEVRAQYPHDQHATNAVHDQAQAAIREEAARVLAEHDAHGNDEELRSAAVSGRINAKVNGESTLAQHTAALQAIADLHTARAETAADRERETHAIASGHITTEARDVADQYEAGLTAGQHAANEHADRLAQAHVEALTALDALHVYQHEGNEEHDGVEFEHTNAIRDHAEETHSALADAGLHHSTLETPESAHEGPSDGFPEQVTHPDHEDYEYEHPHPDRGEYAFKNQHPDHGDYEFTHPHPDDLDLEGEHEHAHALAAHEQERAQALTAHEQERASALSAHEQERAAQLADHVQYNADVESHNAELGRRAEAAQTALETLHERQLEAHAGLKEISAASEKAHGAATARLGAMDEDHHVTEAGKEHEDAHTASATLLGHAQERLDERGHLDFGEVLNSLKDESKGTARAIKELAKYTGRAPRIAGKTKKRATAYSRAAAGLLEAIGVRLG